MRAEELEQLVLHVGQVEGATVDGGLVRLQVEHERSVLDQLGSRAPPGAPEQVLEARLDLARMRRPEAEVVEEVLTQLEVADRGCIDDQQQRLEGQVALAQGPAERERAFWVRLRRDDGARPAVVGL